MALNTQSFQQKDDQKTKQEKATIKRKTPYIYTQKKRLKKTQDDQVNIFIISILTSTTTASA
jgi:hypothetical protein